MAILYLTFFLLIVNVKTYWLGNNLPKHSFQENCGNTIGFRDTAGEITFKSSSVFYTSSRDRQCDVTVSPKLLGYQDNQVMFYFTEFDLVTSCQYSNLTVYDGRYYSKIKGLQDVLCGHNTSLKESKSVFNSTRNEIRLLFRWNEYGELFTGSFKLTFITYYKGPCSKETDTFACSNDRCIPSNISCNEEINYCGNGDDVNCPTSPIFAVLKVLGIIILVVIILNVIVACTKHYGSMIVPSIRSWFDDCETGSTNRSTDYMNYNAGPPSIIESRNRIVSDTRPTNRSAGSMNYYARRSNVTEGKISVPDTRSTHSAFRFPDGAHDALQAQNTVPSASSMKYNANSRRTPIILSENNHVEEQETFAPPMSEMTFNTQPPSYEDVTSNTDKYVK